MGAHDSKTANLLSYLTFIWIADVGVVGGLLVVNERSRPIEFHCTTPVPQSRIHEILYGATFEEALFVDQLGKALFSQISDPISTSLGLVVTDEPRAASLRRHVNTPLAILVKDDHQVATENDQAMQDRVTSGTLRRDWTYEKGGHSFANVKEFPEDQASIRTRLGATVADWDLAEPFQRIRSAIEEAQRAAA